jgi:hypothetical protein
MTEKGSTGRGEPDNPIDELGAGVPLSDEERRIFDISVKDVVDEPAQVSDVVTDDTKRPIPPEDLDWGVPPKE